MVHSAARNDGHWQSRRISLIAHLVLLLGAATAVFMAGSTLSGKLGTFLVVAGVALLACPPQVRLEGKLWAVAGGVMIAAALALLPSRWFPEPAWRETLMAAGVPLPGSVTPMPEETWFWLAVLAVAVLVGLFGLAHPLRSRAQLALAVTGAVICGAYASLAIYAHVTGWEYPFDFDPGVFGFFWNINHTSSFLVTGCLLALATLGVAYRGRHWVAGSLAAACLAVCAASLFFFTTSRGGIISFVLGALLWFFGIGAANRSRPLMVSFAALFLGSVVLFLASESAARQRLLDLMGIAEIRGTPKKPEAKAGEEAGLLRDGRLLIYSDTLRIVRDYPLTGTGLGTFRSVFPLYRERSLSDKSAIHPESDWLMLVAEAGLPAIVLLGVGIGMLVRRVWRWRDHPYWPLRWGILCAGLAALLHGFVDVPAHNTALGWWILVIFGLGFQSRPRESMVPVSRVQHGLFVLAGLGAFALGLPLLQTQWLGGAWWPPNAAPMAEVEIIGLRFDGKLNEAAEAARKAIRRYPLGDRLYSQLGVTRLAQKADEHEVDRLFKAGRLVNPIPPDVPVEQGLVWIDTDLPRTLDLWQEALRRRERIDRHGQGGGRGVVALYTDLLRRAAEYPELQRQLLAANARRTDLVLVWIEVAAPALVAAEISRLAAAPAFVNGLEDEGRRRFLQAWYGKGDRESLFRFIGDRPDWQGAAWPIQIRTLIDARDFKQAIQLVARRYEIDLSLPPPGTGNAEVRPGESANAADDFHVAWQQGNTVAADRILGEARVGRSIPPEIWRLSAAVSVFEEKWPAAWQHLERYLRESGRGELP